MKLLNWLRNKIVPFTFNRLIFDNGSFCCYSDISINIKIVRLWKDAKIINLKELSFVANKIDHVLIIRKDKESNNGFSVSILKSVKSRFGKKHPPIELKTYAISINNKILTDGCCIKGSVIETLKETCDIVEIPLPTYYNRIIEHIYQNMYR
jgi:hypothetical protein